MSYLEYFNQPKDFTSVNTYASYLNNQIIKNEKLYRYYFPAYLSPEQTHGLVRELDPIPSTIMIYPGYDFSLCKQFNFPDAPLHSCDYFTLVYMMEGEGSLKQADRNLGIKPGDLYLIPPNVDFAVSPANNAICIFLNIRTSFLATDCRTVFSDETRLSKFVLNSISNHEQNTYAVLHTANSGEIKEIVLKMFVEYLDHELYGSTIMRCFLTALFAYVLRDENIKWECSDSSFSMIDHMHQINRYIQQNYRTATLTGLSKAIHFSKQYICRVIHRETGSTFSTLLNQIRIETACDFLKDSNLSIEEIAYHCGFSETANFTRQFKRVMGIPPSVYRKQNT